ncbi:MAG: sigma-70 family RNA polymerase sigma factor [Myxococcales bacterium]|nr:sigma-70 family RNA polymerase sigma factor [Myxococcales bacterium]
MRTFLYAVARNQLFKHYRASSRRGAREAPLDERTCDEFGPDPDAFLREVEERRLVLKAMRRIPLDLQIAIELNYWEGMNATEIASVLDIPAPTVRRRLQRAKQKLAERVIALADTPALLASVTVTHGSYLEDLRRQARRVAGAETRAEERGERAPG